MFAKLKIKLLENNFLKNILIYGISNGISAVVPLLLLPLLTYYLTPSEYGMLSIFLLLAGIFTILTGTNVNGALSIFYFKLKGNQFSIFVTSSFFLVIIVSAIYFLLIINVSDVISGILRLDKFFVYSAFFVGVLNVFYLSGLAILQVSNRAFVFLKVKLLQVVAEILLTVALVVALGFGLVGRALAYSTAIATCALAVLIILKVKGYVAKDIDREYIKSALRFGMPLLPHALSGSAIMYADRVVITGVLGISDTGIYMAGIQLAMVMLLLIEPVNKAYAPWLFSRLSSDNGVSKEKIVQISYGYFCGLVGVALILFMLNDFMYYLLVDKKFYEAKSFMLYLYLGFAFQGMYYVVTNYIFFVERTGLLSTISLTVVAGGAVFSYFMTMNYGLIGAAISFMMVNFTLFISVWAAAARLVQMPWFNFYKKSMEL